ncbi:hypothetical protein Rleg_5146 (plasmid) [Rhizobium leguminosarum bv. trifolii WSM1325]|uniref:Uncharacterized protein n=1 Tax=Rhizobium leguminosarum bv. trifolii (strain WSM1325) TaxID=395491 RepID=C6B5K0_RHILS|nr:hypothetical protein Rleg_5146 [Rhizobium leguminosarum bv. trifolii WSM1325]
MRPPRWNALSSAPATERTDSLKSTGACVRRLNPMSSSAAVHAWRGYGRTATLNLSFTMHGNWIATFSDMTHIRDGLWTGGREVRNGSERHEQRGTGGL